MSDREVVDTVREYFQLATTSAYVSVGKYRCTVCGGLFEGKDNIRIRSIARHHRENHLLEALHGR